MFSAATRCYFTKFRAFHLFFTCSNRGQINCFSFLQLFLSVQGFANMLPSNYLKPLYNSRFTCFTEASTHHPSMVSHLCIQWFVMIRRCCKFPAPPLEGRPSVPCAVVVRRDRLEQGPDANGSTWTPFPQCQHGNQLNPRYTKCQPEINPWGETSKGDYCIYNLSEILKI